LLPRVRHLGAGRIANPISAVSWWKIVDNLRRSLVPVATFAALVAAALLLPPRGVLATMAFVAGVMAAVPLLTVFTDGLRKPTDVPFKAHGWATAEALGTQAARLLFSLVFIPYDAFVSLDAIVRTLARLLLTRRRLLEWKTASDAHSGVGEGAWGVLRAMLAAPALTLATGAALVVLRPTSLLPLSPLLALWLASPAVAWGLSRTLAPPPVHLSRRQRRFLHGVARRTWRYFETFVTEEDNWLPPDNVHERASDVVASRTSPTNIGIALLANLAAADFGYASVATLVGRTRKTLETLARLERYRGHFYNWYDTRSLKPLHPPYVSAVNSGNLLGHLLVLRSGLF
jgi:cyclic beta-1,2-glucan synthetase